jgi:FkbM family methyltransferase
MHMINEYQLKVYAVDPTLKHRKALSILEEKHKGNFIHLPYAITAEDGALTFYESTVNESGSILADHINMRMDETTSYEVKAISLKSLLKYLGVKQIDLLKLDIEGAEYDLISRISREELLPFKQIFIEFHHHAVTNFSEVDTKRIVERVCGFGFKSFSVDDHNYLFSQVS